MDLFQELYNNTRETGGQIFDVAQVKNPLSAALEQPDKVFVHFLKKVAPGFVGNATEFLKVLAWVEETFELVSE